MKVYMLSINVRGLNEGTAVDTIQAYIQDCNPSFDFVTIQEHKLRGPLLAQVGQKLWRQALCFGLKATVGYGHDALDAGAGCGGVLTLVHPRWARNVRASGSLFDNRV